MDKIKGSKYLDVKLKIVIYILLFPIIYGVSLARVYDAGLAPFGVGIVFSLISIGFNGYYLSIVYLLGFVLANLSLNGLFAALNVCLILSGIQFVGRAKSRKYRKWQIHILSLCAQVLGIALNIGDVRSSLALFVAVVLGQLFLYVCLSFSESVCSKKGISGLSIDDKICGGVILIIFMLGLTSSSVWIINIGIVFGVMFVLLFTHLFNVSGVIVGALLIGVGFSLSECDAVFVSMFLVLALIAIAFKSRYRIFGALGIIFAYIIFNLFFGQGLSAGEVLSAVCGACVFLFIPRKYLAIKGLMIEDNKRKKFNAAYNCNKIISHRLSDLSKVFSEMTGVYKSMVRGVLDDEQALILIKEELKSSVCKGCPHYENCYFYPDSFVDSSLDSIVSIAYEKDKILLIDLPQFLTSNCIRINNIISVLNNLILSYKGYATSIKNLDASRVLIADQLSGVSLLLQTLSQEVLASIDCDYKSVEKIRLGFEKLGIECVDCAVYNANLSEKYIVIHVTNDDNIDNNVLKVVKNIIHKNINIASKEFENDGDIIRFELVTVGHYGIALGSSVATKSGKKVCGDTHSFQSIGNSKYLLAICDGMGSGEKAKNISSLTTTLISYFYKAGFSSDIILSSINKLLSFSEEDNYSTLDLCVVDTNKCYYDFIKLGACNSYILRNGGNVEIIESSNLPIGVLEDISPHITRKAIFPMDTLIFVSDGVLDSFLGNENFVDYIKSLDIINPQTLSDKILAKAKSYNNNISIDDMTVLCVRILEVV